MDELKRKEFTNSSFPNSNRLAGTNNEFPRPLDIYSHNK